MRSSLKSLIAVAAAVLVVPSFASADDMGGGDDLQEVLSRMSDLEQQLRATNDALAAANARVDRQQQMLSQIGSAKPSGAMEKLSSFLTETTFGGWVSASYFYNTNNPDNGSGFLSNSGSNGVLAVPHHPNSNSFQVDQVWFEMSNEATPESRAGFEIDILYGETADQLAVGFEANSLLDYLYSANVSYLAPITDAGIKVTAGRFATHIGAEVAQTPYNYNITRGLLYTDLQPVNHTGVKIGSEYDNGLHWMLGVANDSGYGANSFLPNAQNFDSNDEKAFLWSVGYKMSDTFRVVSNGIYGTNCSICATGAFGNSNNDDQQHVADMVIHWDPSDKLSTYLNLDYVWVDDEERAKDPRIFGVAVAGRYAITDATGFSMRGEYVHGWDNYLGIADGSSPPSSPANCGATQGGAGSNPPAGSSCSVDHDLWSLTATLDHALTEHLTVKAEVVYQEGSASSGTDNVFFVDDNFSNIDDSQVLLGVQMTYQF
jgi:hypothetical protein